MYWAPDTTWTNINAGGDYFTMRQFPGPPPFHDWVTSTPGYLYDSNGYNICAFRDADPCVTQTQVIEFDVTDVTKSYEAILRHPATLPDAIGSWGGYWVRISPSGGQWWKAGSYQGGLAAHSLTGPGTIRYEVTADVCSLYIQGNLIEAKDFSSAPITSDDMLIGFGVGNSGAIITSVEGGDIGGGPPPTNFVLGESGLYIGLEGGGALAL